METKCPVCQNNKLFAIDEKDDSRWWECVSEGCSFNCNDRDLPRIAAAMELARMEYALEHCEPQYEHEYQFHLELAKKHVLEVFGGE